MSVRMTNFAPVYPFDPANGTAARERAAASSGTSRQSKRNQSWQDLPAASPAATTTRNAATADPGDSPGYTRDRNTTATGTPHGTAFSETAQLDKGAHPGQAACKPLTNVLTAGLHIIFVSHHHPRDRGDGRAVAAAQIQAGIADLQAYEYPRGHHQAGRVARTARSGPIFRHDLPQRSRRDESDRLGDPQRGARHPLAARSEARRVRPPPHRSCSPSPPERTRTSCRSNCSAPMR